MNTTFKYDHYYDYDEVTNNLQYFEETYPDIFKNEVICISGEGKNVYAVTISDGDPLSKPALYMDGNHHAGEVTGSMACMHLIDVLLTNSSEEKISKIIKNYTFYIIPKISPDGSDVYLHTANKLRSVNRPYPLAKEGSGLHAKDINDDGVITMMRVKSKMGAWKKLDDFNMTKRGADEIEGEFYNIYPEGYIKDYNGTNIEIGKTNWGLDFNRNYPFGWFSEYRQSGAGKYPLSNPENKAVADFVINHPNIGFVLTMHTTGGVLVYPPGTFSEKDADKEDMKLFESVGKIAMEEMAYPSLNIFDNFLLDNDNYSSGAFDDWCYHTQGIPAITVELWNAKERAGVEVWPVKRDLSDTQKEEDNLKLVNWIKENCPEAIIPWQKYDHPNLGEVEIGGINFKFSVQNCPNNFLLQEVDKTTAFALRLANILPKVVIDDTKVEKLADDLYKVDIKVANYSFMPTYISNEAKHIKVNKDMNIELMDCEVIMCDNKIKELAGFSKIKSDYSYDGITTYNHDPLIEKASYLIKTSSDSIKVKVDSQKAGVVIEEIKL